jgi:hypothetical protein
LSVQETFFPTDGALPFLELHKGGENGEKRGMYLFLRSRTSRVLFEDGHDHREARLDRSSIDYSLGLLDGQYYNSCSPVGKNWKNSSYSSTQTPRREENAVRH